MSSRTSIYLAALCAILGATGSVAATAVEPTRDFTRYQVILDRAPFGKMNDSPDNAQQPSFSTRFTFVGTGNDGDGLVAFIQENDTKRIDIKAEGETIGPVKVVKIEKPENGPTKLVLKQDLEVATLTLEAKPGIGAGAAPGPQGQPAQPGQPQAPFPISPGVRRIPFRRGG